MGDSYGNQEISYIDENIQIMKYSVRLLLIKSKYVQEAHINYLHQDQTKRNSWCKIIDYLLTQQIGSPALHAVFHLTR